MDIPLKIPLETIQFDIDCVRLPVWRMRPGGDAANSSVILTQLKKRVALAGVVGADYFGESIKKSLQQKGVCTDYIYQKKDVSTTTSVVLINASGQRMFATSGNSVGALRAGDVDFGLLDQACHLNYSSIFNQPEFEKQGARELFEKAKEKGLTISADADFDGNPTQLEDVVHLIALLDVFMPSYIEARQLTGEAEPKRMVDFIVNKTGEKIVIIKMGEQGCFVHENGSDYMVPSYKVEAVDTTGAGDCFVAGFLYAYLEKMPVRECVRFGSAAAAINVQAVGATSEEVVYENIVNIM